MTQNIADQAAEDFTSNPLDDDKLREECGIFGISGKDERRVATAATAHT